MGLSSHHTPSRKPSEHSPEGKKGLFGKRKPAEVEQQQERLTLDRKGVVQKTHIQEESFFKRVQLRKQSEGEIAKNLREGTRQMDTRNSMSRAFHKELTGGLFTGGLLGPLFVGNKTNGAIREIRKKYGDDLANRVAQNVGVIKSQAPGVQEILSGEKELSRGAMQLLRKLNGNMSEADIQEYWQSPTNRKNIQRSVTSFAVSAVLGATTGTIFLGNMLTPIPIGDTPIPGKGVYNRTLFGGKYKGSGDPVQPAIDALSKSTRDSLRNGTQTSVGLRQAAGGAVGAIGREVELARGAVNPMLGFINAIGVDTALKNKMEKYSEMMEDPNISPDELQKALKLQYEIRNKLAVIKDNAEKKGKRDSDYYSLVQSTLQGMTVTRDAQTLESLERRDRDGAFIIHQYQRMDNMLPTAGIKETSKAVKDYVSGKGNREQTLQYIKAQPGVTQMIQAYNSGLNSAIGAYERVHRPLAEQTRIHSLNGKWGENLTGYDARGVANYFDTRTNQRGNLANSATILIRNTLGGNVDFSRAELIQAIARGKNVSSTFAYNTGRNATNIPGHRTAKGESIQFTLPYEKDGIMKNFVGNIVLECANVNPDGTYRIDTDALPKATLFLRLPVGFQAGGGGGGGGGGGNPQNSGGFSTPGGGSGGGIGTFSGGAGGASGGTFSTIGGVGSVTGLPL